MTDDPLSVSPYLLRPLRSYAEVVRDRERLALAGPVRGIPEADGAIIRPGAAPVPAASREDQSTNKSEEDFK